MFFKAPLTTAPLWPWDWARMSLRKRTLTPGPPSIPPALKRTHSSLPLRPSKAMTWRFCWNWAGPTARAEWSRSTSGRLIQSNPCLLMLCWLLYNWPDFFSYSTFLLTYSQPRSITYLMYLLERDNFLDKVYWELSRWIKFGPVVVMKMDP